MIALLKAVLFLSAACFAAAVGPPIPSTPDGYSLGPADAPVHIEAFYDLMCPNCLSSWPSVKGMLNEIPASKVRFTVHLFPLPYHRNAYLVAQAATALGQHKTQWLFQWMETIYANQESLGNGSTEHMSTEQVKQALVSLAAKHQLPADVVEKALSGADADMATRVSWKYACYRGVFGTPTYLVNGVPAPDEAGGWNASQWVDFVNGILSKDTFTPLHLLSMS